jgi:hypothetical protein
MMSGVFWSIMSWMRSLSMGFRRFSHAVSTIIVALKGGDIVAARRALANWRGTATGDISSQDVARLAIERGMLDAFRQVFAAQFLPDGTRADWAAFDQLQRRTTSPENAVRFLEEFGRIDVRDEAGQVFCPALILH